MDQRTAPVRRCLMLKKNRDRQGAGLNITSEALTSRHIRAAPCAPRNGWPYRKRLLPARSCRSVRALKRLALPEALTSRHIRAAPCASRKGSAAVSSLRTLTARHIRAAPCAPRNAQARLLDAFTLARGRQKFAGVRRNRGGSPHQSSACRRARETTRAPDPPRSRPAP